MVSASEAGWRHWKSGSTLQVDEQPSPLFRFPSSHSFSDHQPVPHFEVHWPVAALQSAQSGRWRATVIGLCVAVVAALGTLHFAVAAHRLVAVVGGSPVQAQPGLNLQGARTCVGHVGSLHAGIALLHGLEHHAVAAVGYARALVKGTGIAGLDLAGPRAAISGFVLPSVALLAALRGCRCRT